MTFIFQLPPIFLHYLTICISEIVSERQFAYLPYGYGFLLFVFAPFFDVVHGRLHMFRSFQKDFGVGQNSSRSFEKNVLCRSVKLRVKQSLGGTEKLS